MNIPEIMAQIDMLYSQQKIEEVESLLCEKIGEFKETGQIFPAISLSNELLGIYREKGDDEKGLACCGELLRLFRENNLKKDENYGTTLLNIATAHRAFESYQLSQDYYKECAEIFERTLAKTDYRFASLYNNLSLLLVETEDYQGGIDSLKKSLEILAHHENVEVQIATAHTTLAQIHLNLDDVFQAQEHIETSLAIFKDFEDYHGSAALATAGDIQYLLKNYTQAANLYHQAMQKIEMYIGRTENYKMLEENWLHAKSLISPKGLELSKAFYLEYGVPMIKTHFPQYENQIAVGLVGEGSECFGLDDAFSSDHDYGAGFCLWLPDELYRRIGVTLQSHYDQLPKTYKGITRKTFSGSKRVGVFSIPTFYCHLLETESLPISPEDWYFLEDASLAHATNGQVFRDDLGQFSQIRTEFLRHYPLSVLGKKMAQKAHIVSQTGQYNLERTLKRGDFVTAQLILSQFLTSTMELCFLLSKTYAPFYKWTYKTFQKLYISRDITPIIEELTTLPLTSPKVTKGIEKMVAILIEELKQQNFVQSSKQGNFLDLYVKEIAHMDLKYQELDDEKTALVTELVNKEWNAFDKVDGMDGRASCQDDYETFQIMRSSQFSPWTTELLDSYLADFQQAEQEGQNLITIKYAFMMKSTDPENFKKMESRLPQLSQEQLDLIEDVVEKQLTLMLSLHPKYPNFVSSGRSLRSSQDSLYNTSYETYLRGELSSYSLKTVKLYHQFLVDNHNSGINTAKLYMENVAKQYGYPDIESAEESMSQVDF